MGSSKSKYQSLLGDPGLQWCICPETHAASCSVIESRPIRSPPPGDSFLTSRNFFSQASLHSSLLHSTPTLDSILPPCTMLMTVPWCGHRRNSAEHWGVSITAAIGLFYGNPARLWLALKNHFTRSFST